MVTGLTDSCQDATLFGRELRSFAKLRFVHPSGYSQSEDPSFCLPEPSERSSTGHRRNEFLSVTSYIRRKAAARRPEDGALCWLAGSLVPREDRRGVGSSK